MRIRLVVTLLLFVFSLLSVSTAFADSTTIDFEGLPDAYMFLGGSQNIDSLFSGVTLGPNVTGLDLSGSTAFPPRSGSIVVWDPIDLDVTITFAQPINAVSLWYTSFDPLTLAAFDNTSALLGSVVGAANTDGTTGTTTLLSFNGSNISAITLTGSPGNFVFDDLTFPSSESVSQVPEPPALLLLLIGLAALVRLQYQKLAAREYPPAFIHRTQEI